MSSTLMEPLAIRWLGSGRSLNHALEYFGYPSIKESEVSQFVGPPLDQTFASLVGTASPEHIAALVSKYRERYADIGFSRT